MKGMKIGIDFGSYSLKIFAEGKGIVVDEPSIGSLYGSTVAAPYVGNVMSEILGYLDVEPIYTQKELENI